MIAHSKDFSFGYDNGKDVFANASFTLPDRGIVGLLGANGAGKSTLFDLLSGTRTPSQGEIRKTYNSDECFLLVQSAFGPPLMSVGEYLQMVGLLNGGSSQTSLATFQSTLERDESLRLQKIWGRRIGVCSKGEWQWMCAALAFSFPRKVYLLDEPTAGVDPEFRHHIWIKVLKAAQKGSLVIVSSHLLDEMDKYVDKLILVRQKQLETYSDMSHFVAAFGASTPEEAFVLSQRGPAHVEF